MGEWVGTVGLRVGDCVGLGVGSSVGIWVGFSVGHCVGRGVGSAVVGIGVGNAVGKIEDAVGVRVATSTPLNCWILYHLYFAGSD